MYHVIFFALPVGFAILHVWEIDRSLCWKYNKQMRFIRQMLSVQAEHLERFPNFVKSATDTNSVLERLLDLRDVNTFYMW